MQTRTRRRREARTRETIPMWSHQIRIFQEFTSHVSPESRHIPWAEKAASNINTEIHQIHTSYACIREEEAGCGAAGFRCGAIKWEIQKQVNKNIENNNKNKECLYIYMCRCGEERRGEGRTSVSSMWAELFFSWG